MPNLTISPPHGREVATEKRNLDPLAAGCFVFYVWQALVFELGIKMDDLQ